MSVILIPKEFGLPEALGGFDQYVPPVEDCQLLGNDENAVDVAGSNDT